MYGETRGRVARLQLLVLADSAGCLGVHVLQHVLHHGLVGAHGVVVVAEGDAGAGGPLADLVDVSLSHIGSQTLADQRRLTAKNAELVFTVLSCPATCRRPPSAGSPFVV